MSNRRQFLARLGIGSMGAMSLPATAIARGFGRNRRDRCGQCGCFYDTGCRVLFPPSSGCPKTYNGQIDTYYYYYCWSCPTNSSPTHCGGYDSTGPAPANPNGHCMVTSQPDTPCSTCGANCSCPGNNQVATDMQQLQFQLSSPPSKAAKPIVAGQLVTYAASSAVSKGASDFAENIADFKPNPTNPLPVVGGSIQVSGLKPNPVLSYFTDPGVNDRIVGVRLWNVEWINPSESSELGLDRTLRIGIETSDKNTAQSIGAEYVSNDQFAYHINYQGFLYSVLLNKNSTFGPQTP
jgi:hypothetical protein